MSSAGGSGATAGSASALGTLGGGEGAARWRPDTPAHALRPQKRDPHSHSHTPAHAQSPQKRAPLSLSPPIDRPHETPTNRQTSKQATPTTPTSTHTEPRWCPHLVPHYNDYRQDGAPAAPQSAFHCAPSSLRLRSGRTCPLPTTPASLVPQSCQACCCAQGRIRRSQPPACPSQPSASASASASACVGWCMPWALLPPRQRWRIRRSCGFALWHAPTLPMHASGHRQEMVRHLATRGQAGTLLPRNRSLYSAFIGPRTHIPHDQGGSSSLLYTQSGIVASVDVRLAPTSSRRRKGLHQPAWTLVAQERDVSKQASPPASQPASQPAHIRVEHVQAERVVLATCCSVVG